MLDKDMFFNLTRQKNKDQAEFFEEASAIYLGLANKNREDVSVEEFARKIFEND